MKKHPEYMILIAVVAAFVIGTVCLVSSCSSITSALGIADTTDGGQIIEDIIGGDDDVEGDIPDTSRIYDEDDVPDSMVIDVDELQDDIGVMINYDITGQLAPSDDDEVTVSDLTKDSVADPTLRDGLVICQVSGKVTITNRLGESETVDYTSYYYAADPTVEVDEITWYIYAYDLSSYDVLPEGVEDYAGDPLGLRAEILGDDSSSYATVDIIGGEGARDA